MSHVANDIPKIQLYEKTKNQYEWTVLAETVIKKVKSIGQSEFDSDQPVSKNLAYQVCK